MGNLAALLYLLLLHLALGKAQQVLIAHQCKESNGKYTSNSIYKSNLNTLLTSISSNSDISYGFFNFSSGKQPDQVNSIALCRGDLGVSDCHTCLDFVISNLTQLCPNQKEAIGWADTCMLRYSNRSIFAEWEDTPYWSPTNGSYAGDELYKFYNSSESTVTNTTNSSPNSSSGKSGGSIVVIVVAVVASLAVLAVIFLSLFLRRRRKIGKKCRTRLDEDDEIGDEDDEIGGVQSLHYDLDTIRSATGNFSKANKVGRGEYGDVYKGTMINGREVAVKRLTKCSGKSELEFKNEVFVVAKLQHRNLVRLLGFCLEDQERLLIYEFVPNASLGHFLFDEARRAQLDWETRYEIIVGVARGLLYLHEGSTLRIIHRDLKPSNVLLDAEMRPKIADFGMIRLFQVDQTQLETRRVVGTFGYMAPEYALHGFFSIKSDVYSFGVLVLEILTGQRCINFHNDEEAFEDLVTLVWRQWNMDKALDIVDPVILSTGPEAKIRRCIHIALLCVQDSAADRPAMSSVAHMLSAQDFDLAEPHQPAYVRTSSMPADSPDSGSD